MGAYRVLLSVASLMGHSLRILNQFYLYFQDNSQQPEPIGAHPTPNGVPPAGGGGAPNNGGPNGGGGGRHGGGGGPNNNGGRRRGGGGAPVGHLAPGVAPAYESMF